MRGIRLDLENKVGWENNVGRIRRRVRFGSCLVWVVSGLEEGSKVYRPSSPGANLLGKSILENITIFSTKVRGTNMCCWKTFAFMTNMNDNSE